MLQKYKRKPTNLWHFCGNYVKNQSENGLCLIFKYFIIIFYIDPLPFYHSPFIKSAITSAAQVMPYSASLRLFPLEPISIIRLPCVA